MDAKISNQGGQELADRIKEALSETKHRFELHDPLADTTHRFQTAEEAVTKVEEIGATRFQGRDSKENVSQINKIDDQWKREDGKSLVDIQTEIDKESVLAIEIRAKQRASVGPNIDSEIDKQMALADASSFRLIQDPAAQETAAVQMADNTRTYPAYKEGLEVAYTGYLRNPPKISDIAIKVATLDAAHFEKAKDNALAAQEAKFAEQHGQPVKPDTEERLNESRAEDAATKQSGLPESKLNTALAEQEAKVSAKEMGIDPAALERVAASRNREFAQVREAMELNIVEPNIEKQQQQLTGEEEDKRAAWLKKGEEARDVQASNDKSASGNQVESDEVFTASQSDIKPLIPPEIEKQYLRVGDKFYHPKNTDMVAFEDKGNKLETKSNSENIAESMVRIAEARGWDEIKVSGSETFRREVWLEAAARGMQIKGYTPTEQDKVELAKRTNSQETNKIEKDNKPFRARENDVEQKSTNKDIKPEELVAHGAAKYLHEEKNSDSYFVTTKDSQGQQRTSWGVDLERALNESGVKIGDKVVITNEGRQPVTVNVPITDEKGTVVNHESREVHRNKWNIELAETFSKDSPEEAVKKHPELAGAAALAAAMDKKAEADGLSPAQREIVTARVRQNLVNSIERGNIPEINIKEEKTEVVRSTNRREEREYSR
jgi:hypothetical protein